MPNEIVRVGAAASVAPPVLALVSRSSGHVLWAGLAEQTFVFAQSDTQFFDTLNRLARAAGVKAVVWELSSGLPHGARWQEQLLSAIGGAPVLLRADLTPIAARAILAFGNSAVAHPIDWRVSITGADDIAADLLAVIRSTPVPDAHVAVLTDLAPRVDRSVGGIVAAAILLGRRRTRVESLARACRMAVGTLRAHLRTSHSPSPHELVAWSNLLHTAWRIDVLGLDPKAAAFAAGFGDSPRPSASLGEQVWRSTGHRLLQLRDQGSFVELLSQFETTLARGQPSP